jgi:excisionase family DNA binding protein
MTDNGTEWLTIQDVYERLGKRVPIDSIRSWIRTKKLRAFKPGKVYLIRKEDFEKFLLDSQTDQEEE